jgi:RHS repeat-associated protein
MVPARRRRVAAFAISLGLIWPGFASIPARAALVDDEVRPSLADQPIELPAPPPPIDDADRYPVIAPVNLDGIPADATKVAPGEKDPTDPSEAVADAALVPVAGASNIDVFAPAAGEGTHVALVYPQDVNEQTLDGKWNDISFALSEDGKGWGATIQGTTLVFPATLSQDTPVSAAFAEGSISIAPVGTSAKGSSDGFTVTYASAFPSTDFSYRAVPGGYSEEVVFADASAKPELTYAITTAGLTLASNEAGGFDVFSGDVWVGWIPTPIAYDSGAEPLVSVPATKLTDLGNGSYTLEVTLDAQFMASAKFPVILDPQVNRNPSRDGYTNQSSPNTSYEGATTLDVSSSKNSFLRYDISGIQNDGRLVYDATMFLYPTTSGGTASGVDAKRVTSAWPSPGTLKWNNQPTAGQTIDTSSNPAAGQNGWWTWQLKELYQHYIDQSDTYNVHWPDYGVRLSSTSTKSFYSSETTVPGAQPILYITFNDLPHWPSLDGPANGFVSENGSPTLSILGGQDWPNDQNGDDVFVNFQISDNGTSWTGNHLVYESPFNDSKSFTIPSGVLTDGQQYWWRAQSADICVPPDGVCTDRDGAGTDHGYNASVVRTLSISLQHLGDDSRYAMWSHDVGNGMTMKVNESNGNLFLDVPLDVYQTPTGPLSVGLTYNSLQNADYGMGPGWDLAIGPAGSKRALPVELVKLDASADSDVKIRFGNGKTLFFPHKDGNIYGATSAGSGFVRRAQDSPKSWTYVDADGGTFTFLPAGKLDQAMPSQMSPSVTTNKSIDYTHTGANNNLTHVEDTIDRAIDLAWTGTVLNSITATGFGGQTWTFSAPSGKLASISTTVTVPGSPSHTETVAFDYDLSGLLDEVKNAAIQAAVPAQQGWTVSYGRFAGDTSNNLRVLTIKAPSGTNPSTAQPWNFGYHAPYIGTTAGGACIADPRTTRSGTTWCDADFDPDGAYETQVEFNTAGLPIEIVKPYDANPTPYRQVLSYVWDSNLNLSCERSAAANALGGVHCWDQNAPADEDPDGLSTTYTYETDPPYRMLTKTDPAADLSAYPRLKQTFAYDSGGGFNGLWIEKYGDNDMAGLPDDENLWTNFDADWGTGAAPGVPGGGNDWSLRWTGWLDITAAQTKKYAFRVYAADGVNLTVGGKTILSCFGTETFATDYNCGANQDVKKLLSTGLKPITIEYSALTGNASFQLKWDQGTGNWATMTGSLFQPNLGLVTSKTYQKVTSGSTTDLYEEVWTYPTDDFKARHLPETYRRTDLGAGAASYVTGYGYNQWGQTTTTTTAKGTTKEATITNQYKNEIPPWGGGAVSCLTTTTGALGEVTNYECSVAGDTTKVTQAVAAVAATGQAQQTRVTITDYDSLGRAVKVTGPVAGAVTTTAYDLAGRVLETDQLLQSSPALHAVTTNTWDASGRVTQVQGPDPDGQTPYANRPTTINTYDWADNLDVMADALNRPWTHNQDALNREISLTSPLGAVTATAYRLGSTENSMIATSPAGVDVTTTYDVLGRTVSEKLEDLNATTTAYDVLSNATTITDPAGIQTKNAYDNLSELTSVTNFYGTASAATTTSTYDLAGQLKETDGPRTTVDDRVQFAYDLSRRLTTVTQPGVFVRGSTTVPITMSVVYDDAGERARVEQKMSATQTLWRSYLYDVGGRLASYVDARGTTTTTYNLAGWPTQVADPRPQTIYFGYDALGRRICRYTSACNGTTPGAETYAFDKLGHVTQAKNASITYDVTYDNDGRLWKTFRNGSGTPETTYTYNASTARLTSILDAAGTTSFTYNTLYGQLLTVDDPLTTGTPVSTYGYQGGTGRLLTRTDSQAGVTWTRTYEAQTGRTDKLEIKNTSTQAIVASFDPTYDGAGNITQKVSTVGTNPANGTWTYIFDGANRMTRATGPGLDGAGAVTNVQRDYAYDGAGNRFQAKETKTSNSQVLSDLTTTYDDAGMPTTATDAVTTQVTNYTHDAIGDLKVIDNTTDNSKDAAYGFDVYGRLVCAQMAATTCSAGVTFALDALGRQFSRTLSGTTTTTIDQGLSENPSKTQVGAGTPTTYAYTALGAPLGQKSGSTVGYFLRDLHGDVVGLASGGASTGSTSLDTWGRPIKSTAGYNALLGFQGDVTDPTTGQVDMGTRWYEPGLGRFSSRDGLFGDIGSPNTLNQFTYGGANPITMNDPTGMKPLCEYCVHSEKKWMIRKWVHTYAELYVTNAVDTPVVVPPTPPISDFTAKMNSGINWKARAEAAEDLIAAYPDLGPDLVDEWLRSTFGDEDPFLGIEWDPQKWRDGSAAVWWIVRAFRNRRITSEFIGLHKQFGGGPCVSRAHALWVCYDTNPALYNGLGTTYGNVFLTGQSFGEIAPNDTLWGHETVHSDQWAIFGEDFWQLYTWAYIQYGDCNFLEREAGFEAGHYTYCT